MKYLRRIVTGTLATVAIVAATAVFSSWPAWRSLPTETGVLSLSFSHGGARTCRSLTEAELQRLPANMRRREVCDRKRAALRLEFDIDGQPTLREVLEPSGLAGDGPARLYERYALASGAHDIGLRLADSGREQGFDYQSRRRIDLAPAENAVIDFRPEQGGFVFK